jgi:hypothetical protein
MRRPTFFRMLLNLLLVTRAVNAAQLDVDLPSAEGFTECAAFPLVFRIP